MTRREVSFEELAYSNMLLVQALIEELVANGLLDRAAVLERVKKLRSETNVTPRSPVPDPATKGRN